MKVTLFKLHPALYDFIDNITLINIDFREEKDISPIYTFVPTHNRFFSFFLGERIHVKKEMDFEVRERAVLIGPQTKPVTLSFGKTHKELIVCLKPCGMFRLLGIPLSEIVDKDFDARSILGKEIDTLTEQLRNAKSDEKLNRLIQLYLLQRLDALKPALPFDLAMFQLVNNIGNLSMDFVAAQSCMSVRQFQRKSLERIGLSPKLFARMIRFSKAYKLKELHPQRHWIDIAHECGYFDQMHFIRDFKYFAGFAPSGLTELDIMNSVRFRKLEER